MSEVMPVRPAPTRRAHKGCVMADLAMVALSFLSVVATFLVIQRSEFDDTEEQCEDSDIDIPAPRLRPGAAY